MKCQASLKLKERLLFQRIIRRGEKDNYNKENALTQGLQTAQELEKNIFIVFVCFFHGEEIMLRKKEKCEEVGVKKWRQGPFNHEDYF